MFPCSIKGKNFRISFYSRITSYSFYEIYIKFVIRYGEYAASKIHLLFLSLCISLVANIKTRIYPPWCFLVASRGKILGYLFYSRITSYSFYEIYIKFVIRYGEYAASKIHLFFFSLCISLVANIKTRIYPLWCFLVASRGKILG